MPDRSPLPIADVVGAQLQEAVDLVILGRLDEARGILERLPLGEISAVRSARLADRARASHLPRDVPSIRRPRRTVDRQKLETFARDCWVCRFCGARTIDLRVLRCLSRLFPETLPFHPNWKFSESHLVYWTHSTSLEHVVPFARGGPDEPSNFVTTCYACNDARRDLLLEEIGWTLQPVADTDWRGLADSLAHLSEAVAAK